MATAMAAESSQLRPTHELNLQKVLAMGKGDEEDGYNKNSTIQDLLNNLSLPALNEALERVSLLSDKVVVADLGSSLGPNAVNNVALIFDKLRQRLLFPQSSVDVFFSSISLHWMSQIPDAVLDEESSTYNRGSSWIVHTPPAVAKSYQQQASVDLKNFLSARAAELASGGLMFFWFFRRPKSEPNAPTNCFVDYLQFRTDEVWSELVEEGLVAEHDKSTFNYPLYLRSVEEAEEAIASCGLFNVLTLELQTLNLGLTKFLGTSELAHISGKLTTVYKALMNDLLEAEVAVGKEISGTFWQRFAKSCEHTEDPKLKAHMCIVSLIRK